MSTAAVRIPAQSERKTTPGTFEAPRSLIENASLLTRAELLLALIVHRVPADPNSPATISESTWIKWTGLKERAFELAVAGLQKKGLEMRGRGKGARFYWDETRWTSYIREHSPEEKARTEGRKKSVPPRPGQQIHPDCALKGCQKLCDTQKACEPAKVVSIASVSGQTESERFAQPVAQTACNSQILNNREIPTFAFPLALSAVQVFFPASDQRFTEKLLSVAKRRVENFSDEQLAAAVRAAHKPHQKSDGLFLHTVPGALAAVVEGRIGIPAKPELKAQYTEAELQAHIEKHTAALKRAGMEDLAQRARLLEIEDFVKLDDGLLEIEKAAIERLRARAPVDVIRAAVEPKLKPYKSKMTAEQVETVRQRFIEEKLLTDAGLARMSLYYL